jgi:cyclic beta-1,2-glucan synthetase
VAIDAAVKFSVLKVRNESGRPRRLSATGYVEWVLGDLPAKSAMHVITEIDRRSGALFARNPIVAEFADRVAFFDVDDPGRHLSGDRTEFLGRNGSLRDPAAMRRSHLSGRVGPGWILAARSRSLRTGRRAGAGNRLPARRRAQRR